MLRKYFSGLSARLHASLQIGLRLISDPHVYLEFLAQPWPRTLTLFLVVTGLIGALNGIRLVYQSGDEVLRFPQALSDEWVTNYPPNLVINWQDQSLTLEPTPTQPVVIPWPAVLAQTGWPGPLAIYDPQAETQPADVAKSVPHEPLFILDQRQIWAKSAAGEWSQSFPLTDLPVLNEGDQTWNKAAVVELLGQTVAQLRHWLKTGLVMWPFASILLTWWVRIWFVLTESTLLWALGRLIGWRIGWKKLTKLVCLIVPVAEVINWLGHWLYPDLSWSLFHVTFWLLLAYLSLQFPKQILNFNPKPPTA